MIGQSNHWVARAMITLAIALVAQHLTAQPAPVSRVLFVGNSYLYYNDSLHNHVKRMAMERFAMGSGDFQYKSSTIGGARLKHHNIDWLLKPGQIGVERPFQVVIMQGGSAEPLSEQARREFVDTAVLFSTKIRQKGGKPMLYMTHAYVQPHRRADKSMIKKISSAYRVAAKAADVEMIPVGLAYERSYRERPDFLLHADFDGTHPNLRGTYLGAYLVFLSLYGVEPRQLTYDYYGRLPAAEVGYLQRIARETVAEFSDSQI